MEEIKELRTYFTKDFYHPTDQEKRIKILGSGLLHAFVNNEFKPIEDLPYSFPEGKEIDLTNYIMDLPGWGTAQVEESGKILRIFDEKGTAIYRFHSPAVLHKDKIKDEAEPEDFDECQFEIQGNKLHFKLPQIVKNERPLKAYDDVDNSSTNNADATLNSQNNSTNYGSYAYWKTQFVLETSVKLREIVKWTLPSGSGTITQVSLYACVQGTLENGNVNVHQLTRDFVESEATWDSYSTGNAWATAGGDFSSTIIDVTACPAIGNWQQWDLKGGSSDNPLTLTWSDSVLLLLKCADEELADHNNTYYSKEYTTDPTKRPYLQITYTPPAAAGTTHQMII